MDDREKIVYAKLGYNPLHLVLKGKWFDMIADGTKKEEYREIKPYWAKRLTTLSVHVDDSQLVVKVVDNDTIDVFVKSNGYHQVCHTLKEHYDTVIFHRGYTSKKIAFKLEDIIIGKGDSRLGAPNRDCFIIKLGEQIRMRIVKNLTINFNI